MEERSSANFAQNDAVFPKERGVFVEFVKIEMENIIAWSTETPAQFIWIRSRRNPSSMFFLPPPLFPWQQWGAISSVSFVRIGKSLKPFPRMFITTIFPRR
jgi:hypothetical protein